jgi:anti-sigma28 factor (negative regulator of flagellin synthesis)
MKVNGSDSNGIKNLIDADRLERARKEIKEKETDQAGQQPDDALSVSVAQSKELSKSVTAQAIIAERQARVAELQRKYQEGTLKPASSREIAEKLLEGIDDMVAIAGVSNGDE